MKKITLPTLLLVAFCFFLSAAKAQNGYTYTLVDNGSYNFTISAVPSTSTSNFGTSVQSYGFAILVPDGITVSITSSLGNGASTTFFNGTDIGQPTVDGYLITETLGSPMTLPAPSSGIMSPIVTIQINGSPVSGTFSILANDSVLANTITPLKSFMQADMIDDAMAAFTNVINSNTSGLSGVTTFDFNTLSTPGKELTGVSIYPNPAKNIVNIKGLDTSLTALEIYNSIGQLIATKNNDLNTFNVSKLKSGVYFVKIYAGDTQKTFKLIKQ
ncbi:T9SS type A sorting domain-containing protein [uncultured Kordia sp.]|uniref:T9SS type A sorting domain-containing protein n=1 Tax=uncultured Kordia sp. TaxID=507699 RepID=UPI00263693D2|nr:T9SS type A sorting domain-containing protein [uncultured Kordia sp.]